MITNNKLRHAVLLAEHQSFRAAASALNLTQPALTHSIQSLERSLGAKLFDRGRGPGRVEPTAIGRLVIDRARDILLAVEALEHEVRVRLGLGAGTLEVSLGSYPSALSGRRAVAQLLSRHPDLQCRVRVAGFSAVGDDVAEGRCEIGVADLEAGSERGLVTEALVNRRAHLLCRPQHPLAAGQSCSLRDVLDYPWAAIRFPKRAGSHLPEDVGKAGRWDPATGEFVPALEADVVSDFLALAKETDVLVAVTLTMAEKELAAGELAVVPFSKPWLGLHYGFITRPNHTLSPAALRFMDIVREIEAELEEREAALRRRYL